MSCNVTVDGPCRRTLNFSLERDALTRAVEARIDEIARTSRLKGFRPGKAPTALIRRTHGKAAAEEARRELMGKAFSEAVKEHKLRPVGDPVMNLQKLDEGDSGPVTFEFEVEVAPDISLALPERFAATVILPPIGDELVDSEVTRMRERFGRLEDAAEGAAIGSDDLLEGTVSFEVDGAVIATRSGRPAFLRHGLVDGVTVEGAAAAFEGHKLGDTVEVSATLPEHFEPKGHADAQASIRFVVERHRILVLPELQEEQFKAMGVENLEQLRERIQAALEGQRAQASASQVDRSVEDQLLAAHEFELPERLLARTIDKKVHELAHNMMERQKLSSEDAHHAADERRDEVVTNVRKGLALAFVLDAIARANDLGATIEESVAQVRALASREGADPDQTLAAAAREGWIADVQEQITQDKVRAWLRERVDVTEQAPEPQAG